MKWGVALTIKVLIAEDSAFQRKIISEMLSSHQLIEIIDVARNGIEAIDKVEKLHPDVLVLDLIMPQMDGLTAFKEIMRKCPLPTIIFSVIDPQSLDKSVQALLSRISYLIVPSKYNPFLFCPYFTSTYKIQNQTLTL